MGRSKAEQETIIRWDEEERVAWLSTTSPAVRERWARKGVVWTVLGTVRGVPCSWSARVNYRAVSIRRVDATGQPVKQTPRGASKNASFRSAEGHPARPTGPDSSDEGSDTGDGS